MVYGITANLVGDLLIFINEITKDDKTGGRGYTWRWHASEVRRLNAFKEDIIISAEREAAAEVQKVDFAGEFQLYLRLNSELAKIIIAIREFHKSDDPPLPGFYVIKALAENYEAVQSRDFKMYKSL